jgi:hypothetical protein
VFRTDPLNPRRCPATLRAFRMRLLWSYVERCGRPVSYYTDKASLFQTAPKIARDSKEWPREEREPLPPTQIGRALRDLDIVWIAAIRRRPKASSTG